MTNHHLQPLWASPPSYSICVLLVPSECSLNAPLMLSECSWSESECKRWKLRAPDKLGTNEQTKAVISERWRWWFPDEQRLALLELLSEPKMFNVATASGTNTMFMCFCQEKHNYKYLFFIWMLNNNFVNFPMCVKWKVKFLRFISLRCELNRRWNLLVKFKATKLQRILKVFEIMTFTVCWTFYIKF